MSPSTAPAMPRAPLLPQYGADLVYSEEIVDFKAPLMKRVVNGVCTCRFAAAGWLWRVVLAVCRVRWGRAPNTEEDGTVDFFSKGGRAVCVDRHGQRQAYPCLTSLVPPVCETRYRTCPREAGRNVVQLGSSSATRVLACATHLCVRPRAGARGAAPSLHSHVHCCCRSARDVSGFDVNMGCPKRFSMHAGMGAALLSKVEVAADVRGPAAAALAACCVLVPEVTPMSLHAYDHRS